MFCSFSDKKQLKKDCVPGGKNVIFCKIWHLDKESFYFFSKNLTSCPFEKQKKWAGTKPKKSNILLDLSLWYLGVFTALLSESHLMFLIRQLGLPASLCTCWVGTRREGERVSRERLGKVRVRPRRADAELEPEGRGN